MVPKEARRQRGESPQIRGPLPGPRAAALVERDRAAVSPSYTRGYPLVIAQARGSWVWDVDGNQFLDFNAGVAVCATGGCHPQVVRAVRRQAGEFLHYSGTDFYYAVEVDLAERLGAISPTEKPAKVFFGNSGAEAVEAAIKLARYHTGRPGLISFHGAFHGRTLGALSLSSSKPVHKEGFGPLLPGVIHVPYANCFRCPLGEQQKSCALACLRYLEEQVLGEQMSPTEVAAIVVEPIQGEGGYVVPAPGFLPGLRRLCDRIGALLVVDEVQSGTGRTGRMFAIEHEGVQPDIVCMAKGIASGLPLGAMIAPASLMNWPPGAHASTFGGNPVSCAAALATLDLLEHGLLANVERQGKRLARGLRKLMMRFPAHIGDARGRGLMQAIDFVGEDGRSPNRSLRDAVVESCFQRGLLLLPAGPSAIRFCPPLTVKANEVDLALQILEEAVSAEVSSRGSAQ